MVAGLAPGVVAVWWVVSFLWFPMRRRNPVADLCQTGLRRTEVISPYQYRGLKEYKYGGVFLCNPLKFVCVGQDHLSPC